MKSRKYITSGPTHIVSSVLPCYSAFLLLMKLSRALSFTLLALSVSVQTVTAEDDTWRRPLRNRNQFPPALLFIFLEPERATVLEKDERLFGLNFDYSNILVSQQTNGDALFVDAEYLRSDFRFETGLGRGLEVRASIPFYVMYGGFLDGFISGFHQAFGFPNAGRENFPNDEFHYLYRKDGESVLDRNDSAAAFGDLTVQIKKALMVKDRNELAVRGAVKLPTGSRESLTGSGKTDFALGLLLSRVGRRFGGYFNINFAWLGKPDGLETRNHLSFMGAFDWRLKPTLAALIQYQHQARFLRSEIPVLDQSGRQLVLGLRWRRSGRNQFEWRFAEDLSSTAPDFTFGFQWTITWAGGNKATPKSPQSKDSSTNK
jgi:hypothetical protein